MKPIICTIAAAVCFGFALLILVFYDSRLTHSIILWMHPSTYQYQYLNVKLGLGSIGTGLAILAWGWSDAWRC